MGLNQMPLVERSSLSQRSNNTLSISMVFKQVSLVERSSLCKKHPLSEVPPCHDNSLTLPAALSQQDPEWYSLLTSRLSPEQTVQVQEFLAIADKRVAARRNTHFSLSYTQCLLGRVCRRFGRCLVPGSAHTGFRLHVSIVLGGPGNKASNCA